MAVLQVLMIDIATSLAASLAPRLREVLPASFAVILIDGELFLQFTPTDEWTCAPFDSFFERPDDQERAEDDGVF